MSDSAPESSPPLAGECVTFTGTLASMTHEQAGEVVSQTGGVYSTHLTRGVTLLVVGEEGWPLEPDGSPSQKLLKANEWMADGQEMRVLPESDWLYLVGLSERQSEVRRHYTPAMLSQMLEIPVTLIRRWARAGLIRPHKTVYRLPYFEFGEVAAVQKLAGLLTTGVSASEIERSLRRLRDWLPGFEQRSLAQLELLAGDRGLLYRDEFGPLDPRNGHRLFDFDPPQDSTAEPTTPSIELAEEFPPPRLVNHFDEGCRLLTENRLTDAVSAFREALAESPGDAEVHFHLAEALYRQGRAEAAAERYFAAIEHDRDYLEAWTALGCVQTELGDLPSARGAFETALQLHAEYPDAHWHLGSLCEKLGESDSAVSHWQQYLNYDERGPWADAARQNIARLQAIGN